MWLVAGLGALMATVVVAEVHPRETASVTSMGAGPPAPRSIPLAATYAAAGFGYIITATYVTVIVRDAGLSRFVEASTWLLVGLSSLFSPGLWSVVRRRVGTVRGLTAALIVQAVGIAALVWRQDIIVSSLAAVCLGGTFMGITAMTLAEARARAGPHSAGVMAMLTTSYGAGQAVGPLAAGALAGSNDDLRRGSVLAIAVLVAGCVAIQSHPQRDRRARPHPPPG
jgi:hypothetical protein